MGWPTPPKYPVIVAAPSRWTFEPSVPFVSSVSTTLAPMICIAAATAARSPSASCSFILRTRIQRPGMSVRSAIALRAAATTHGKYWSALTSSVTAMSSRNVIVSARPPRTPRRIVGDAHEGAAVALLGEPFQVGKVARLDRPNALEQGRQLRPPPAPGG